MYENNKTYLYRRQNVMWGQDVFGIETNMIIFMRVIMYNFVFFRYFYGRKK